MDGIVRIVFAAFLVGIAATAEFHLARRLHCRDGDLRQGGRR